MFLDSVNVPRPSKLGHHSSSPSVPFQDRFCCHVPVSRNENDLWKKTLYLFIIYYFYYFHPLLTLLYMNRRRITVLWIWQCIYFIWYIYFNSLLRRLASYLFLLSSHLHLHLDSICFVSFLFIFLLGFSLLFLLLMLFSFFVP